MANRQSLPKRLEKAVFQQFSSQCAFCEENEISALQIHHIEPFAQIQKHELNNLILVCANCHARIEAGEIPKVAVQKRKISANFGTIKPLNDAIQLVNSSNSGIIANNLTIKHSRLCVAPINETIGSNRDLRNYIKYLIDRYHEFKIADVGKENMKYQVLYKAIIREFGAKWDHIGLDKFENLVQYLHYRIDVTILGKNQKAQGKENYRSFESYQHKYGL